MASKRAKQISREESWMGENGMHGILGSSLLSLSFFFFLSSLQGAKNKRGCRTDYLSCRLEDLLPFWRSGNLYGR